MHLSNNAIQCKYLNGERSGELPEENMWDVHQFKDYLRWVATGQEGDNLGCGMQKSVIENVVYYD